MLNTFAGQELSGTLTTYGRKHCRAISSGLCEFPGFRGVLDTLTLQSNRNSRGGLHVAAAWSMLAAPDPANPPLLLSTDGTDSRTNRHTTVL